MPTVAEIDANISARRSRAFNHRRATARRFAAQRALFSRLYAASQSWFMNPAKLTADQVAEIHAHPQWLDPVGCPTVDRLFVLDRVRTASGMLVEPIVFAYG